MLYTASFYDTVDWVGRAYRVSRAHPRGRKTQWDTLPFLYPSRELLRAYQQGDLGFEALARAYREELEAKRNEDNENGGFREWLKELPGLGDITLLCFERAERPCHRRIAAQWLVEQAPELRLGELR